MPPRMTVPVVEPGAYANDARGTKLLLSPKKFCQS
jgi:hypothetical protein